MKSKTATPPTTDANEANEQWPTVADYVAAGHDQETAEALAGFDAFCTQQAESREAIGAKGRELLAEVDERHGRKLDADPRVQAEREASRLAMEACFGALAQGETAEVARQRAQEACGRSELRFDYTERAEELRREAFAEWSTAPDVKHKTEEGARNGRTRPRARQRRETSGRRSSSGGGDSGSEDGESEPPPAGRRCKCGCDLSLVGLRSHARYLNDAHRKRAQRDRDRLQPDRVAERRLAQLAKDEAPPPVRCKCDPKGHLVDENVCVPCGRARGNGEVAWLTEARDLRSKQLVARAPARRNPRYGDRKPKPVREFVDEAIKAVAA